MAFYDIFEQLCAEKGVTPTQAGRDNGIAQGVVSMWKKRGSTPNAITLVKLAEYFNTTPAYLAGNPTAKAPVRELTFNATPDPEWAELESKLQDGTATSEDFQRYKDLVMQSVAATQAALSDITEIARELLVKMAGDVLKLNEEGQQKAIERIEELTEIPKYQRQENTPPPPTEGDSGG